MFLSLLGCTEPAPRAPARAREQPAPDYIPCDELGDRRFDRTFCVHAEAVRVEDVRFDVCPTVTVDPSPALNIEIEEQLRAALAEQIDRRPAEIEIGGDGLQAMVALDACIRLPHEWTAEERRREAAWPVEGIIDASRPMRVELRAARWFTYHAPGIAERRGVVGEWPHRTQAPPVEWLGYPSCGELPQDITPRMCIHAEHVQGDDRALTLCDRFTITPSLRLIDEIEWRITRHLAIGERDDERIIDVTLAPGADYVISLDACIVIAERDRSAPVRGTIDGDIALEVERASFRYRFGAVGDFQDGSMGHSPVDDE